MDTLSTYDILYGTTKDCTHESLVAIAAQVGCEPTRESIARTRVEQISAQIAAKKKAKSYKRRTISAPLTMRYEALRRAGGRCELCGASAKDGTALHVDHIKPKSIHGEGANTLDNLQVLCSGCNIGKSNLYEDDWRPA